MSFRLLVINPNSDAAVTEHLRLAAARVLPDGSRVDAVDCPQSPPVIETALDDVLAGPAVVAAAAAGDPDAFLIGCFGDPAVSALRELTAAPVVGLGEAALVEASLVTSRFGVITTLDRGIPALWSQLEHAGAAGACAGIRSVEAAGAGTAGGSGGVVPPEASTAGGSGGVVPPEASTAGGSGGVVPPEASTEPGEARDDDLLGRLAREGQRLLADGADGLVLACAGFGRCREPLAAALDVPVCDGIGVGACLAYGLFASGTRTSKRGGYAWPDRDVISQHGTGQ